MITKKIKTVLIVPVDNALSFAAKGVLATMLNDPCCDYQPIEKLYEIFQNDNRKTIKSALTELCEYGYIFKIENKTYAVNKLKISQMKII